jgi:hypothetical protein
MPSSSPSAPAHPAEPIRRERRRHVLVSGGIVARGTRAGSRRVPDVPPPGDCYPVVPTRWTPLPWVLLPKDRDLSEDSGLFRTRHPACPGDLGVSGYGSSPSGCCGAPHPAGGSMASRATRRQEEVGWCCRSRSPDCVRTATSSRKRRPVPSVGVTACSDWRHGWVASITGRDDSARASVTVGATPRTRPRRTGQRPACSQSCWRTTSAAKCAAAISAAARQCPA